MSQLFGPHALRPLAVHRFAARCRPLKEHERDQLRGSLQRGYDPLYPIVVTPKGEIVDGRNRRDLCCELGIAAFVVEREFADDAEIMTYVRSANLARRHLDRREQRELAGRLVMNGTSTREAAKATGVSKATAQRAAAKARKSGVSSETPARTNGADGKSYPATKATPKPTKPDPRIARVRKALDLLAGMAGETIPAEIRDALNGDELVALVAVLDVLAKTSLCSQARSGRHASTTVDSTIAGSPAA